MQISFVEGRFLLYLFLSTNNAEKSPGNLSAFCLQRNSGRLLFWNDFVLPFQWQGKSNRNCFGCKTGFYLVDSTVVITVYYCCFCLVVCSNNCSLHGQTTMVLSLQEKLARKVKDLPYPGMYDKSDLF